MSTGGYEMSLDKAKRVLRFRVYGLWDEQVARQFKEEFCRQHRGLGSGQFQILADVRSFPAQKPEISALVQENMVFAAANGMTRAAHIVDAAMTEIQVKRMGTEANAPEFGFFRSEAEALDWLSSATV